MLRPFCHLTVSWVRRLVHPDEVVTVKRLLFRSVFFTDWDVVLDRGGVCQHLTICRHVLHVDRALLNYWFWILFVDVDNVLRSFGHDTSCWVRHLVHSDEAVTVKRLLFRRVFCPNLDVRRSLIVSGLGWRHVFQDFAVFSNVLHVHWARFGIHVNNVLIVGSFDFPFTRCRTRCHFYEDVAIKFFLFRRVICPDLDVRSIFTIRRLSRSRRF